MLAVSHARGVWSHYCRVGICGEELVHVGGGWCNSIAGLVKVIIYQDDAVGGGTAPRLGR